VGSYLFDGGSECIQLRILCRNGIICAPSVLRSLRTSMIDAQYYDCVTSDKWVISTLPFVEDFDSVPATEPPPAGE
jgi:hypothetical protein